MKMKLKWHSVPLLPLPEMQHMSFFEFLSQLNMNQVTQISDLLSAVNLAQGWATPGLECPGGFRCVHDPSQLI